MYRDALSIQTRPRSRSLAAITIAFSAATIPSCTTNNCRCTTDFEYQSIHVVDSSGMPISNLPSFTIRLRDKADVTPSARPTFTPGQYVVVDDNNNLDFSNTPEKILFSAIGPNGPASTSGTAYTDECGCHVMASLKQYELKLP